MKCPFCGYNKTGVKSTRTDAFAVYRMRVCGKCGKVFYTTEVGASEQHHNRAYREMEKARAERNEADI